MKTLIALIAITALMNNAMAQTTKDVIKQQIGEGVKQGAAVATEHTADKVLNSIFGKKKKKMNDNVNQSQNTSVNENNNNNATSNTSVTNGLSSVNASSTSLQTYSKYDFVPGEKVLVYEDFSKDAIGDFPANWNTNASGETVTASGQPGQWLMVNKKGIYRQDDVTTLPDNFTYEFDMIFTGDNDFLRLFLVSGGDDNGRLSFDIGNRSGVDIGIQPITRDNGGVAHISAFSDGNTIIDNQVEFHNTFENKKIKISVWRQQQRLRVYIGQDKVFDLPRAFAAAKVYNTAMFQLWSDANNSQSKYLIGNIKLAAGAPDTRNKLINEGKFSTTGILFDVNSANIKPESYGSLKDIAEVLEENTGIRVKIIGHTDSDGDPAMNLALSKKRAEAVKSFLSSEFKIDASRMETDGTGASNPVADNSTAAGKAQNRRVEFVKM